MIDFALVGLVGFTIGVAVMACYGYAVAFLTAVEQEKRSTEKRSVENG